MSKKEKILAAINQTDHLIKGKGYIKIGNHKLVSIHKPLTTHDTTKR